MLDILLNILKNGGNKLLYQIDNETITYYEWYETNYSSKFSRVKKK